MGKLNSRRTGDGGAKAAALPTKQRKARGGTVPETEKNTAAKQKELMPPRAGGLWTSMWRRLRPAVTGSIKKYAVVVLVAVVCRLTRRGYDVRHRGAQWNT